MKNCKNCPHSWGGHYDSLSDWCDECRNDSDTGWVGFTDHSVGRHFNSEEERKDYYRNHDYDNHDYDDDDFSL